MKTLRIAAMVVLLAALAFAGDSEAELLALVDGPVRDALTRTMTADAKTLAKWAKDPDKSGLDKEKIPAFREFCPEGDQQALGALFHAWSEYESQAQSAADLAAPNEAHAAARLAVYQLMQRRAYPLAKLKQALALAAAVAPPDSATAKLIAQQVAALDQPLPDRVRVSAPEAQKCYLVVAPKPAYPEQLRTMAVQGSTVSRIVVDRTGNVVEVTPVQGPLQLRDVAKQTLPSWKYRPYFYHGQPVEMETTVIINFTLSGG